MTSNTIANGILKAVGIIFGVLALLYFLYLVQSVILYIAIAAVISLIGRPIIRFLKRRLKFKNTLAVIFTMTLMIGLLIGLISMFIPLVVEQGEKLSLLNIDELKANIEALYSQISEYLATNSIDLDQSLKDSKLLTNIDYTILPNFFNSLISGFGNFSIGLLSVLFISFFLLKDSALLEEGIMVFMPNNKEKRLSKSFEKIKDLLSRYFVGLVFQILILFIIYTIALLIFGIDNAIVIAFLCALLNLIPYIGPLFSGVLMMILCMTSNLDSEIPNHFSAVIVPNTIGVMIFFVVAQLVDNFLSQPLIFSNSVKSHPLEIFLVIIIWGLLFGILGMVIAVPSYTAIKVILKEFLSENKIVQSLTKDI
ncbi:AI-2E family transporter [Kordia sp. YSTF-M3]|uniref:AI-2E family transporter n=1 Tax=Kordia aestuariivivens TaxID=2759037 RepID=A0ABR7Q7Q0_9FLAO|nr:AI-2E family transporter [Kordia aestuariivivens]MBC8754606.1 AI-2E family transporter [Kordia aestuariivivens]